MSQQVTLTPSEQTRYSRHILLPEIGEAGVQKLKAAKVLVIGAGGLGCPVLQYLTAAGVGTIGIVDFDKVEESNLQRQILFAMADIGYLKADVAREKLKQQNPFIKIISYPVRLTSDNALAILTDFDLVIDGSDNFSTRYLVNDACVISNKPLIFGSIFKFEGQVSVFNYKNGPTYRCLYPEPSELASCSEVGVLGVLPGLIGMYMANEVIKVILDLGEILSGKLLVLNALSLTHHIFSFTANPSNKQINSLPETDEYCLAPIPEITYSEFQERLIEGEEFTILDVRETHEHARQNIGGILIPLGQLEKSLQKIPQTLPILVHCQSGARSQKAAQILITNGISNVLNLKGGLGAIKE
ncbi:molybdopterin-synthase adenylyltransferase MoeB [Adhaeribacter aquaticus]|uniref:molybdopterin-synthase adenylyltransferase MoeB n=1 Tax=Adhaeribacter aquaticus TaxID=299567 RepID=UPI0004000EBB|nr:molybdopterin-synthase adenylyltransferase MoeB [Adhaeribacter aquaticus]